MKILKMHQTLMEPGVEVEKASIDEGMCQTSLSLHLSLTWNLLYSVL